MARGRQRRKQKRRRQQPRGLQRPSAQYQGAWSYEPPVNRRSWLSVIARSAGLAGVLLFVGYAARLDVMLRMGHGSVTGWIRLYEGQRPNWAASIHPVRYVFVTRADGNSIRPVGFTLVTAEAFAQMREAGAGPGVRPALRGVSRPASFPEGLSAAPPPHQGQPFGRVQYAGFMRKVVYDFEELPEQ